MLCSSNLSLPFHLKLLFPSAFMTALEKFSCWTRMDFTLWKEQGKALQNTIECPGLYLFILEVVAAEDEGSKDTKLCMNYDVICSAFSSPLGRPSKLDFIGFFSGATTSSSKCEFEDASHLTSLRNNCYSTRYKNYTICSSPSLMFGGMGDVKQGPLNRM